LESKNYNSQPIEIIKQESLKSNSSLLLIIVNLPLTYWILCSCMITFYGVVYPFLSSATVLISKIYNITETQSATISSIQPLISTILAPFIGYAADKYGYRPLYIISSFAILLSGITLIYFTFPHLWVAFILLGLGHSIFTATFWQCIPLVITIDQTAIGYGITSTLINTSLVVMYYIVGKKSQSEIIMIYVILTAIGIVFSCMWAYVDYYFMGSKCYKSSNKEKKH